MKKGGGTYSDTWEELKKKVNVNVLGIKPGYWENVFRTNTQSAYIAGKLQQYENTGVAAYQLMVIEDGRTSKICRHLLTASGYGMIISVDHPFWKNTDFRHIIFSAEPLSAPSGRRRSENSEIWLKIQQ